MLDTSSRLLQLLAVLQSRRFWTGSDLAQRLEVTPRTLRRDIERLRSLGCVVEATSGPGGGYQLTHGTSVPPLVLDDEEAVAVTVSLRRSVEVFTGLREVALRMLAKLDPLLPPQLRHRIAALDAVTVSLGGMQPSLDADRLTKIAAACRDCEVLCFSYNDRSGGASRRTAEPLRLASTGYGIWYLLAWDRDREDWRTFRVDRVSSLDAVGPTFVPRTPPEDVANFVGKSIAHAPYRYRVKARLFTSAETLENTLSPWCGVLESLPDGTCILTTGGDSLHTVAGRLIATGVAFELLEPEDAAAELGAIARRFSECLRPKG